MSSQNRQFSQRSTVSTRAHRQDKRWGEYQNEGTRTLSGWQWWLLVPKLPVNEHKEPFFFFFLRWPYRTLTVKWREAGFFQPNFCSILWMQTNFPKNDLFYHHREFKTFFSRSNKRRGLTDTINIAHVILYFIGMFLHTSVHSRSYVRWFAQDIFFPDLIISISDSIYRGVNSVCMKTK